MNRPNRTTTRPPIQLSPRLTWSFILLRLIFSTTSIALLAVTVYIHQKWRFQNPNQHIVAAISAASLAISADMLIVVFMIYPHVMSFIAHLIDSAAFFASWIGCLMLYLGNYTLVNGPYAPAEWDGAEKIAIAICAIVIVERSVSVVMSAVWRRKRSAMMREFEGVGVGAMGGCNGCANSLHLGSFETVKTEKV